MVAVDLFTISKMESSGQLLPEGALVFSDYVTTVSKKYSQEIQNNRYGFWLEGVLRNRGLQRYRILNGVDYDDWSPESDKFIKASTRPRISPGKLRNKQDLPQPLESRQRR